MNDLFLGLKRQMNVISALLIREIRLRNSKHAFAQLFDMLEAVFYIVTHWIIFSFTGRHLMIGDSLLTFITTGIFPVLYFRSISIRTATAINASKALTVIPFIQPIDYAFARAIVEMLSFCGMFTMFLAGIYLAGESKDAIPYNFGPVLLSVGLLTTFAFGIGLCNSLIMYVFPFWKFLWGSFSRIQIFFSAVFFIPEYMPPKIRDLLVWNPILHFVSLFRTGFYPSYPTHLISMSYILYWTFGVLIAGFALERILGQQRAMH